MNTAPIKMPFCNAHFDIVTPRPAPNVVAIIDQNDGAMSVTNDAENVVYRLRILGVLRPGDRLIYRDTEGMWDELALTELLEFNDFRPLRVKTMQEAMEIL